MADVTVKGKAVDLKDQDALRAFLSEEAPFDHLVCCYRPVLVTN
jgi:hypothetical protein